MASGTVSDRPHRVFPDTIYTSLIPPSKNTIELRRIPPQRSPNPTKRPCKRTRFPSLLESTLPPVLAILIWKLLYRGKAWRMSTRIKFPEAGFLARLDLAISVGKLWQQRGCNLRLTGMKAKRRWKTSGPWPANVLFDDYRKEKVIYPENIRDIHMYLTTSYSCVHRIPSKHSKLTLIVTFYTAIGPSRPLKRHQHLVNACECMFPRNVSWINPYDGYTRNNIARARYLQTGSHRRPSAFLRLLRQRRSEWLGSRHSPCSALSPWI